jgi:hypothetical protein
VDKTDYSCAAELLLSNFWNQSSYLCISIERPFPVYHDLFFFKSDNTYQRHTADRFYLPDDQSA